MPGEIMKNRMRWDLGVVWLVMAGAWVTPRMTGAEGPAAQTPPAPAAHTPAPTPAPATRREAMLFTVEFGAPCGPPVYPGMLAGVVTSSGPKAGWHFKTGGPPPLVSREAVEHSAVSTSGETSQPAARIFAQIGQGGAMSFQNDQGRNVVLQVDVKCVCWDLDQDKALEHARAGGSGRVLTAVLRSEDLTAQVNPNGEFANQKSFNISLDMTLLDSASGDIVSSFSDETRVMDVSVSGAQRRGAKSLVTKGLKALSTGN